MAFIRDKRELRLRVLRMHQECRAAVDVGAQQAQAFVGGVPRLDHDVVQFVAQKVFDDALVAGLNFEEIGEHAGGSVALPASRPIEKAAAPTRWNNRARR